MRGSRQRNNEMAQIGGITRLAKGLEFNILKLVVAKAAQAPRAARASVDTCTTPKVENA